MARIRTIKPEFWVDDKIVELDPVDRLLFIGLWNFVDDEGYIQFAPKRIKMMIFPADDFNVSRGLANLIEASRLDEYTSDQGRVLRIRNWERHQRVDHPSATKFTGLNRSHSQSPRESSRTLAPEGKGKERKGSKESFALSSEVALATPRPDVNHILDVLDEELTRNGVSRLPSRSKKNVDAARLLIDRDGRSVAQIEAAIRWCQSDEFWRSNVMSMSKLREKYEQLQQAAKRGATSPRPTPMQKLDAIDAAAARLIAATTGRELSQ